jgi:5-methylthioadenosine/S-adenosylhomocysteine deaminase
VTLVGHDLMTDELVVAAAELAERRDTRLTFHLSPTIDDGDAYRARTGRAPLEHLDALGVLGRRVVVAHAVHLTDREVGLLLDRQVAVASCPWAYLRLAQGTTIAGRHAELWRRGGRLAIGCDAENASDAIDPLRAAALFVGLARDATRDPGAAVAGDGLALVTIAGAAALGLDDRIGSLEVGKQADLVVHSTVGAQWAPLAPDPVRQLVWASDGRSVSDVVIAGRPVVRAGRCVTVDVDALRAQAAIRQAQLLVELGWG